MIDAISARSLVFDFLLKYLLGTCERDSYGRIGVPEKVFDRLLTRGCSFDNEHHLEFAIDYFLDQAFKIYTEVTYDT